MRILIIYGTVEGQTRNIALFMEDHQCSLGRTMTCCNAIDGRSVPKASTFFSSADPGTLVAIPWRGSIISKAAIAV